MNNLCGIKGLISTFFLLYTLNFAVYTVFAQPVYSTELINNAKNYDNKTVGYSGEVIGDIMIRGQYAWLNVNDKVNAIGIWLDRSLIKDVSLAGNYKFRGDIIEIEGIFHRSCQEHGGDLDIHAVSLRKINNGAAIKENMNHLKLNLVIWLFGGLALVWIWNRLKRK